MAEINFLPVCSNCHKVLYDREITVEKYVNNEVEPFPMKIPYSQISPYKCRFCGEHFETVTMPTQLPFYVPTPTPKKGDI